jgi:hypothetical protein
VALVVVLVGYPLSFGPACWYAYQHETAVMPVAYFYWPLTRIAWACPTEYPLHLLFRYALWNHEFNYNAALAVILASCPR